MTSNFQFKCQEDETEEGERELWVTLVMYGFMELKWAGLNGFKASSGWDCAEFQREGAGTGKAPSPDSDAPGKKSA